MLPSLRERASFWVGFAELPAVKTRRFGQKRGVLHARTKIQNVCDFAVQPSKTQTITTPRFCLASRTFITYHQDVSTCRQSRAIRKHSRLHGDSSTLLQESGVHIRSLILMPLRTRHGSSTCLIPLASMFMYQCAHTDHMWTCPHKKALAAEPASHRRRRWTDNGNCAALFGDVKLVWQQTVMLRSDLRRSLSAHIEFYIAEISLRFFSR